jgi:hypothetical protein
MPGSEFGTADLAVTRTPVGAAARSAFELLARPAGWALCLTMLLALAILRIVSTYHIFNHTIDESAHVACGIEWLEKGIYRYESLHPPVARVSVALGPYLAGVRGTGEPTMWAEATHILSANGRYWHNLTLARIGVLPYFILATVVVFLWTKRLFGARTGLLAAAVFTLLPTVLAHSAVATTDVAFTALFCCALYAFTLWLREPSWRTATQFGIAAGLALSAKFSTILFLPSCAAVIMALYVTAGQRNWRALLRTFAAVVFCGFFVTWAVYRFTYAPLSEVTTTPDRAVAKYFGESSRVTVIVHQITSRVPVPAPELVDGIRSLRDQNRAGRRAFLFGHVKTGGWWYFYFAALALKTPLAVLLLAAAGTVVLVARYLRNRSNWESAAPLAAAVTLMIVTTPVRINIGVRHVLPMFVFLSILAALGLAVLWKRRDQRLVSRAAATLLFAWLMISSARSHPDYLAYFNELGGSDPSKLLVVSDLDWGQDLARLATWLSEHEVKHINIAYEGVYDPNALGLPETDNVTCSAKPLGWTAVEVRRARLYPECYRWRAQQQSITTVGKTMLIYYVPKP